MDLTVKIYVSKTDSNMLKVFIYLHIQKINIEMLKMLFT